MPLDRESVESFYRAGTIRFPSRGLGKLNYQDAATSVLGEASIEVAERVGSKHRIMRIVAVRNVRLLRFQIRNNNGEWSPSETVIGREVSAGAQQFTAAPRLRGVVYVPENAPVLVLIEMGVTAAESMEEDPCAMVCDPCKRHDYR
jgi:hypothetical protein